MTIENNVYSIGASGGLLKRERNITAPKTSFADILNSRADKPGKPAGISFKRSDPITARINSIEERPSCLICGMTISSEGTCLCAYPTVIYNYGKVSLKHNPSAETKGADTSGRSDKPETIPKIDLSQISGNNKASRELEKIKLRRRCLTCGAPVSDGGSCLCDTLNIDKDSAPQSIKGTSGALPMVPFSAVGAR